METERENDARSFRRMIHLGRLLRCLEAAVVLILLSYSPKYLPAAARSSGEIFLRATSVVVSPGFVFLLGNAIVLVLFAKSRQLSPPSESLVNSLRSAEICGDLDYPPPPHLGPADDAAFEEKAVCFELRVSNRESNPVRDEPRVIRSVTEVCRVEDKPPLPPAPPISPPAKDDGEYNSSDEEEDAEQFRRTIEDFIAKQRFQREESLAVVSCSAGLTEPIAV